MNLGRGPFALTGPALLLLGNFADILAGDQIGQGYILQEIPDLIGQIRPQVMGQADFAFLAITGAPEAGCVGVLIHRGDDLGNVDLVGATTEVVAAARPSHAGDQIATTQLREQLFQVRQRNALPGGYLGQANGTLVVTERQVQHGGYCVSSFCGQTHGFLQEISTTFPKVIALP